MQQDFKVGDKVRLSTDAKENEGYSDFAEKTLIIAHIATKYMPAKEFFAKGKPSSFHPGFDDTGSALYDLAYDDGTPVNYSLYDWELKSA